MPCVVIKLIPKTKKGEKDTSDRGQHRLCEKIEKEKKKGQSEKGQSLRISVPEEVFVI